MDHSLAWVVGWQSVLPASMMSVVTLVMMKWFSKQHEQQVQRRTARVIAKTSARASP